MFQTTFEATFFVLYSLLVLAECGNTFSGLGGGQNSNMKTSASTSSFQSFTSSFSLPGRKKKGTNSMDSEGSHSSADFEIRYSSDYTSTWFKMAGTDDPVARNCLKHSEYYCLMLWFSIAPKEGEVRAQLKSDRETFFRLIAPEYKKINWFSMAEQDRGACCVFQMWLYMTKGRDKNYSPEEYYSKVTDFTSQGKELNYISAEYNETLCVNVMWAVGFGTGKFVSKGIDRRSDLLIFPPKDFPRVNLFHVDSVKEWLTFDWFKQNYICKDQPWICETHDSAEL